MNPISICQFDSLKSIQPVRHELESLERFVEFFTFTPPTVKKNQRGPFFSMAIYKPDTTRAKENVEVLSGIVLDFDNTEDGQLKLPEFTLQLKQLGLIYLYYTTWSHTKVRHRWRLILPFEKAIATNFWHEAHSRVLKLLGNPVGIDEAASRDVARMWIMPCKAEGEAYEIGYEIDGHFLDPDKLPPTAKITLPVEIPSEFYQTTPEDIYEALNCIDADCGYHKWLEIGMGLHDGLGNAGFQIWNSWSSRSSKKYNGVGNLQHHWDSFKPGGGITIRTVFKYAMDAGWRPKPTANPITYVITTGTASSPDLDDSEVENVALTKSLENGKVAITTEGFEEADEFVDPIEKCLADLEPFAVSDIFDFPCQILKSTYDWMQSIAPAPIPTFSLSACLSLLAFLKRDGIVSETNLKTNLYILVIGPSRSGKNNGLDCIHHVLEPLGLKDYQVSGVGSAQGLMDELCQREGKAYWTQDEIGGIFSGFQNKNAANHELRLEQKILTLYNCVYQTTDKIKADKIQSVKNPYLNIFGTTTENIIDKMSPDAAVSGLLARFLVFWYKPDGVYRPYPGPLDKSAPPDLLDKLREVNEQHSSQRIGLTKDAREWFAIFCKAVHRTQYELYLMGCNLDSLVGNLREQILKLSLIVAKSCQVELETGNYKVEYNAPIEINLKDIQWAASVAIHCLKNNLSIASMLTENKNEKHINKIIEYLTSHKGKWVRRRDLCKVLRYALNVRQLDDLLEPFFESKQIIKITSKKGGGTLYRLSTKTSKRK